MLAPPDRLPARSGRLKETAGKGHQHPGSKMSYGAAELPLTMGFIKTTLPHQAMARTYFYLLMGGQIESVPGHPNSKLIAAFSASTHEQTTQTLRNHQGLG